MKNQNDTVKEFTTQFTENYTANAVTNDVVGFYNDAFMMLQHFKNLENFDPETEAVYSQFIHHIIHFQPALNEYVSFDFSTVKSLEQLKNNKEFENLTPVYTFYSFLEAEESIGQIFEEIKTVKEFHKELKEEINYLLDEYRFHLEHLKENMLYDFYRYDDLKDVSENDFEEQTEAFYLEKKKFLQKCHDKLAKK
ncbi:MAG TPA: hypothetical protein VKY33_06795 [Flavobacterium sp.]|nr:hypothetical protein [Flavobacterium sp.]